MRVAIIDYGSGNLRSATKAFERAAREAGIAAEIDLTADAERVRTADRIVLPGVGAYADCRAGLDAVPGMVEAVEEAADRQGAAVPRHLRRHAADVRARAGEDGDQGLRLDRRRREGDRAGRPGVENPADRLEHDRCRNATIRCLPAFQPAKTACTPISCIPTISMQNGRRKSWLSPTMAGRSLRPSRATILPARSSIPRRARRSAWR